MDRKLIRRKNKLDFMSNTSEMRGIYSRNNLDYFCSVRSKAGLRLQSLANEDNIHIRQEVFCLTRNIPPYLRLKSAANFGGWSHAENNVRKRRISLQQQRL